MDVVPDGVEAACYRYQRIPEGVAHPDSEYGVFLSECLAGLYAAALPASCAPPYGELEYAAEQGDKSYADKGEHVAAAVYDGSCAHKYGQCQGYAPQIETQVYHGCQPIMEPGHEPAYRPCCQAGQDEQRKYLGQYAAECGYERYSGLRIEQRYGERYHNRYCHIDDYGVHDHLCHITTQFAGNHCACRGGGTYHAEHACLKENPVTEYPYGCSGIAVHGPYYREAENQEDGDL